jgi:hypothetical protein
MQNAKWKPFVGPLNGSEENWELALVIHHETSETHKIDGLFFTFWFEEATISFDKF